MFTAVVGVFFFFAFQTCETKFMAAIKIAVAKVL